MKLDAEIIVHFLLAILLPPVAVFLKRGATLPLAISVALTVLFWFPGAVYASLIVLGRIE